MSLEGKLRANPVIPLIQADDAATGLAIAEALAAAGMPVVEVVQRTDASLTCLETIAGNFPEVIVGAGTVLDHDQAKSCMDAGARFVVSPGLDDGVVSAAAARGIPAFPGIMTPSELQHAHNLGLRIVKFFPASTAGGVGAVNGLASVFGQMQFIPTGGISAENLSDYLALDAVLACGGSWMTPRHVVASGKFSAITELATEALAIAAKARGHR